MKEHPLSGGKSLKTASRSLLDQAKPLSHNQASQHACKGAHTGTLTNTATCSARAVAVAVRTRSNIRPSPGQRQAEQTSLHGSATQCLQRQHVAGMHCPRAPSNNNAPTSNPQTKHNTTPTCIHFMKTPAISQTCRIRSCIGNAEPYQQRQYIHA